MLAFTEANNMMGFLEELFRDVVKSLVFGGMGIVLFALTYVVFSRIFPLKKEIEVDQNTALAILMGAIMLGIAIILAAAIR